MLTDPHPDTSTDWESLKAIKRGGMQAADDKAMEAYYDAIVAGKSKDEAGEIFIRTYQKFVHGKELLCDS